MEVLLYNVIVFNYYELEGDLFMNIQKQQIVTNTKLKIYISYFLVQIIILLLSEAFTGLYHPLLNLSIGSRLLRAFRFKNLLLAVVFGLIGSTGLLYYLRPVWSYILSDEHEKNEKHRVNLRLKNFPSVVIIINMLIWFLGVFVWALTVKGEHIPVHTVFLIKLTDALIGAIIVVLYLNNNFTGIKNIVYITTFEDSEYQRISSFKNVIIPIISSLFLLAHLIVVQEYYQAYDGQSAGPENQLISFLIVGAVTLLCIFVMSFFSRKQDKLQLDIIHEQLILLRSSKQIDLTKRVPIINFDDLGKVIVDLNSYLDVLQNMISSFKSVASNLDISTANLSSNMNQTAGSVNQIGSNIDLVKDEAIEQSKSVTETSTMSEEIIRTIQQLNVNIDTQVSSVTQSSSAIEEMIANIASIAKMLNDGNSLAETMNNKAMVAKDGSRIANIEVGKISEKSEGLIEAATVIQNIASQTNLLAMNAAIEAAHAGDAGKGFAVVADEIRKLAEESSQQGRQISETIKDTTEIIKTIIVKGDEAELVMKEVFALAKETLEKIAHIVSAMREQERGSQEVLTALKDINLITNEVKDGSIEMLRGGEQVTSEMHKLDELTHNITNSMNEMSQGSMEINKAVQEVNKLSQQNKESLKSLSLELDKFIV